MQIENQEALVDCAISELKTKIAKAKVQLSRVERDNERLRAKTHETRSLVSTWRDRAKQETDENRALECLRRSKQAAEQSTQLAVRLEEHERAEACLQQDIAVIVRRLDELVEQRNTMRTRQTRAEAMVLLRGDGGQGVLEVGEILERWEMRILEDELTAGCSASGEERFERDYASAEENRALRDELARLREETKP
jgi:phage shock protein A